MGIALWTLEKYGYIGNKIKSYPILREFLLLFIFHAFWPYKACLPCFFDQQAFLLITLFRPSLSGLSEFSDLFSNKPFCWELLGFCPRVNRVSTIFWIITKYLVIHLAALDFSHNDRIIHPTRSLRKTLWRRQHLTVPYLLRPASRAIGHQVLLVSNWGMIQRKP